MIGLGCPESRIPSYRHFFIPRTGTAILIRSGSEPDVGTAHYRVQNTLPLAPHTVAVDSQLLNNHLDSRLSGVLTLAAAQSLSVESRTPYLLCVARASQDRVDILQLPIIRLARRQHSHCSGVCRRATATVLAFMLHASCFRADAIPVAHPKLRRRSGGLPQVTRRILHPGAHEGGE